MSMYIIRDGEIRSESVDFINEAGELCALTADRRMFVCNLDAFFNRADAEREMKSRFAMCV